MKIEIGESLFYSWLRHVKECHLVQTNWKVSPQWTLHHEEELEDIKAATDAFFREKYGYSIYKKNASLSQVLQQGECDVLGMSISEDGNAVYAIDVAFHENGLNYGDRQTTVTKVLNKCLRTATCVYGYLNIRDAEIIFASPKIHRAILNDIIPCIADAQNIMDKFGYGFRFRVIANDGFLDLVLNPILLVSGGVADTNELFLRSYQMLCMFDAKLIQKENSKQSQTKTYAELKIGKLAQVTIRELIARDRVSVEEIQKMQTLEYSKEIFDLNFPVLVRADNTYDKRRYYSLPIEIGGTAYMLCSQWFETENNNDRPYLLRWIEHHA